MDERAETEPRFQRASRDRVVVPVEALRSHHPDAELVLHLGAAANALATALRLYRELGDDGEDAPVLEPSRRTHETCIESFQLFLLSAFHLKQAVGVLGAERPWQLARHVRPNR